MVDGLAELTKTQHMPAVFISTSAPTSNRNEHRSNAAADKCCAGSGWESGEEQEEQGRFFKTVVLGGPSQEVMFKVRPER